MKNTPQKATKGRYSRSIRRVTLRERYEEELSAPDLLSLRDETSLVSAQIAGLLEKIDGKGVDFVALYDIHKALQGYIAQGDVPGIEIATEQLGEQIQKGLAESVIWKDLYQAIEQRRKLVETEMKTLNSIGAMLSMEQVMMLISKLVAALTLHITDKQQLAAIHGEFSRVLELSPNRAYNTFSDFTGDEGEE